MYNTFYSRFVEGYPNNTKTLIEGVHYKFNEENQLEFITTNEEEFLGKLFYRNKDVQKISAQVENFLKGMLTYSPTSTSNKWYTAEPRSYDSKIYVYMLKINTVTPKPLEDVKDEIFQKLFEEELTDKYITKKMIELRELNGLEILDPELEAKYIDLVEENQMSYKKTKKEDKNIVAKLNDLTITADDLFKVMDKQYGLSVAASEINYLKFLNSSTLNKIYDYYTPNLKVSERILNKEKWQEVRTATVNVKNSYLSGYYSSYPSWKEFLRNYYGVETVEDLMYAMLYTTLRNEYATNLLKVKDLKEDSKEWQEIVKLMQKQVDDYFSVTGVQVLITVKDKDGNLVKEKDWTEAQKAAAKELYGKIWQYIQAESGDYSTKLTKLVTKYNDAPRFLASLPQNVEAQPALEDNPYVLEVEGLYRIELSKYKTLGLSIEYQTVTSLTNTTTTTDSVPEELKKVAKEIYDSLPQGSNEEVRYGYTVGSDEYEYLISEKAYHLYINTSTEALPTWSYPNNNEKHVLPSLDIVRTITIDNASDKIIDENGEKTDIDLTSDMKNAVSKYFTPIKNEITGTTNVLIQLYEQMKDMDLDFKVNNYSLNEFNTFLDKVIKTYEENLSYIRSTDEE